MTRVFDGLDGLRAAVGEPLGPSAALTVSQDVIALFADATGDHQWIHTDVERATREAGGTIAHGMLTLALVVPLVTRLFRVDTPVSMNYGFDRVRFIAPVPAGARLCATARISRVLPDAAGTKVLSSVAIVDEGDGATYCVADWWTYYPGMTDEGEPNG
ncbi:acyl dehydratase [Microbacterium resistens]|uniref:Acyl dehydratase n=1 Tax=Microbacterium resistens TaxID=156977 RepID=A0ABU1SCI8_9MICO|nr:MaoC family dehydratase [Microbacterium resistens]MDR6866617.1 acyl dehydratase [Microbacterium resistens]